MSKALNKYMMGTRETAIYPGYNTGDKIELTYLVLGLVEEISELQPLVDPRSMLWYNDEDKAKVCKELGDVAWYTFRLIDTWKLDPLFLRDGVRNVFPTTTAAVEFMQLKAGRIAGRIKKVWRDNLDLAEKEQAEIIFDCLRSLIHAMEFVAKAYGFSLEYVLDQNYEKLISRKERGKLQGSGDER